MSNTFTAGQKMRAIDMVPQKIWTVSSTSATSNIGTSETVVGTAPSSTYRAGRAYMLQFHGLIRQNTSGNANMGLRDTNAAGTSRRLQYVYVSPPTTGQGLIADWAHILANTGGSDITSRVLVLTLQASSNTSFINAASTMPWFLSCYEMGDSDDFPEAVAL